MKLFNSSTQTRSNVGAVDTLIGRQTEVMGDVLFHGGLYVDGRVKGRVTGTSDKSASLSVSETGCIEGDVRVPTIVLNGMVIGDVYASEKVTLASKARVNGNVYYRILEMQAGAQVNGQLVHDNGENVAAITHEPRVPVAAGGVTVIEVDELRRAKSR